MAGNDGLKASQDLCSSGIFSLYAKGKERYFMTQEDQDVVVGRIVRERREAGARLAALQAEASKFGVLFFHLGQLLQQNPESINFENIPMPLDFQRPNLPLFKQADISSQKIYQLVKDIQDTMLELKGIDSKAKQLGI
jgi:hypothetical protein